MTANSGKEVVLERLPCIYYPVRFQEDQQQESQEQIKALRNSGSKINAMSPPYAKRLGLMTRKTDVKAQKIDGSALETFGMVIVDF